MFASRFGWLAVLASFVALASAAAGRRDAAWGMMSCNRVACGFVGVAPVRSPMTSQVIPRTVRIARSGSVAVYNK
jgi:hypothetical protein